MEIKRYEQKLTQLFEKFTHPGYVLNSYFAEHLLTHFGSRDEKEFGYKLSQSPRIMKMFGNVLDKIETYTPSVQNFLINLVAIRARSDLQFAFLSCGKGLTILDNFFIRGNGLQQPSMKIAFLNMLMNLPDHSSGISWLIEKEWWRTALKICREQQTVYVTRASCQFLSKFLWTLSEMEDEANCFKILDTILEPLKKKYYDELTIIPTENDGELTKSVMPVLLILHELHRDPSKYMHHTVIAKLFHSHFGLAFLLIGLYETTRDKKVLLYILNIEFMSKIAKRFINKKSDYILTQEDVLEQCLLYFNIIHRLTMKRCARTILDFSVDCIIFWNKVGSEELLAFERNGKTYNLETQLVIVCMIPILCNIKYKGTNRPVENSFNFFDMYMSKMVDMASEHTTRVVYQFRDLLTEENCKTVTINAINLLYSIRNRLDTSQASMVYQSLFYMLNAVVPIDDQQNLVFNINMFDTHEDVKLMLSALNLIHDLVKDHSLNWHVSYEVVCLFNCVMNILKMSNLPVKIIMQVLKICTLAIERFLPPNLALLMESDGSVLDELGDVIFAKMHDVNWEVRDGAMELLLVCTDIAFMKYPSFQKILLRKNLSAIAMTIALNDSELYVRCTALQVMATCIRVPTLYNNVLEMYPNLPMMVISMHSDSHEALLRKNVINLIRWMCFHDRYEDSSMCLIYRKMAAAALDDFNWEVQLAALGFWECMIKEHLSSQGMIDGKFPSVTFSKKERKIVTLTKVEIQKRLIYFLNQIAEIGCLKVLLEVLEGEHEIEVVELALKIVTNLLRLLTLYDIDTIEQGLQSTKTTGADLELIEAQANSVRYSTHTLPDVEIDQHPINVSMETEETAEIKPKNTESDDVIESILETDDIKLLANIYAQHLTVGSDEPDQNGEEMSEDIEHKLLFMCPKIFLHNVRNTDYQKIINGRKEWNVDLKNLNSLMDDILGVYENPDVNNLDCY